MNEEHCGNCRYWIVFDDREDLGDCKRFPPQNRGETDSQGESLPEYPTTEPRQWCGEWNDKPDGG